MLYPLSKSIIAANAVLGFLATLAVTLRMLARRKRKASFGADDHTIIIASVIGVALCISGIYAGVKNLLVLSQVTPAARIARNKFLWSDVLLCHLVYGMIKISILLFYKRVFPTKKFKMIANSLIGVVIIWMILAFFIHVFSRVPVSKWFAQGAPNFGPLRYSLWLFVMSVINMTLDVCALVLPLPVIKNLNMRRKQKVSLTGVFGLGLFCVVASAVRTYYTWRNKVGFEAKKPNLIELQDVIVWNDIWAHTEACASIVAACLPPMAPLFRGVKPFEMLVQGMRSLTSLKSVSVILAHKSSKSDEPGRPSMRSITNQQGLYHASSTVSDQQSQRGVHEVDEEAMNHYPANIMVKTSFGAYTEELATDRTISLRQQS